MVSWTMDIQVNSAYHNKAYISKTGKNYVTRILCGVCTTKSYNFHGRLQPYGPLVFFQSTTSIGFSPLKTGLDYNVDVALLSPHFSLTTALAGLHVQCTGRALCSRTELVLLRTYFLLIERAFQSCLSAVIYRFQCFFSRLQGSCISPIY